MAAPIRMNFQIISKGEGGGGIFNPKIHVADFGNFSYYLALVPPCIYSIISIIKQNYQGPFGIFPKNHPIWCSHPSLTEQQVKRQTSYFMKEWSWWTIQYSRALHFARFLGLPHLTIFCAQNIAKGKGGVERVFLWACLLSISKWFQSRRTDLI